jgi:uncharacterized protein DUF6459
MTGTSDQPTPAADSRPAPVLRLIPPPSLDPPYDDEAAGQVPVIDGSLALAFPADAERVPLRLVPPAGGPPGDRGPAPAPLAALPSPRPLVARLAQAVVEVLAGVRSAAQLSSFATLEILHQLERATGRLSPRNAAAPARRPIVSSVRVCRPSHDVAEACAVFDTGSRHRAIAFRLEAVHGHWRCTELQLG